MRAQLHKILNLQANSDSHVNMDLSYTWSIYLLRHHLQECFVATFTLQTQAVTDSYISYITL